MRYCKLQIWDRTESKSLWKLESDEITTKL